MLLLFKIVPGRIQTLNRIVRGLREHINERRASLFSAGNLRRSHAAVAGCGF